jgi:hypothetical protein
MQGINGLCFRFMCYAGLLVISLGLQISHPEMFALLCTPLPLGDFPNPQQGLELPLNRPVVPKERIK